MLLPLIQDLDRAAFVAEAGKVVESTGEVRLNEKRITLEIYDLSSLTQKEEVKAMLWQTLGTLDECRDVKVLSPNERYLRTVVVALGRTKAYSLEGLAGQLRMSQSARE